MTSVLVIGSHGFTGRYLLDALSRLPELSVFESRGYGLDLRQPATIRKCLDAVRPDVVVNLGGISAVNAPDVRAIYEVNAFGMLALLEALNASGFRGRLVFASSANVYGNQSAGVTHESHCPRPVNHYAVAKTMAESYCAMIAAGKYETVIVRPFNCIGVGQSDGFLVPKLVKHFRMRSPEIELGNIAVRRDFSDIRDIAEMYSVVITAPEAPGTINFCSGTACSIVEMIEILQRRSGHTLGIKVNPGLVRSNDLLYQQGSRALLDALGHRSRYSIEDTLLWMYDSPDRNG